MEDLLREFKTEPEPVASSSHQLPHQRRSQKGSTHSSSFVDDPVVLTPATPKSAPEIIHHGEILHIDAAPMQTQQQQQQASDTADTLGMSLDKYSGLQDMPPLDEEPTQDALTNLQGEMPGYINRFSHRKRHGPVSHPAAENAEPLGQAPSQYSNAPSTHQSNSDIKPISNATRLKRLEKHCLEQDDLIQVSGDTLLRSFVSYLLTLRNSAADMPSSPQR